jgi:hypothetical protein
VIDDRFVILGVAISAIGQIAYVRDTLRGTTKPNRVTFVLWALAPLLAFAVQLDEGVGLVSLSTLSFGLGPLAILLASFANPAAYWRLGRFDYVCGAISVLGTAIWLVTQEGTVAIAAAVGADALAGVPTFTKAWRNPETETPLLYLAATLNGFIALLAVDKFTLIDAAFPVYIVFFGAVLLTTLLVRSRR